MAWIQVVPALSNIGRKEGGRAYCAFCPYTGSVLLCGACCRLFGGECRNFCILFKTYLGMDLSTYPFAYSHFIVKPM